MGVPAPAHVGARPVVAVLALLLLALVLRSPAFLSSVLDPDESLYLLQAREWLRGGWPYVAVWDVHPVGAPALYALAMAVFGETMLGARILGVLSVTLTAWLLRGIVVSAGGGAVAGFAAGAAYIAHSILQGGLATNTEVLFAPLIVGGVALAMAEARRVEDRGVPPRTGVVLGMGLLFGLGLWVKQIVAIEASAAFLCLVGLARWRGALTLPRLLWLAVAFAAACGAPTAATAAAYALRGELDAFVDASILAPLRYRDASTMGAPGPLRGPAMAILDFAWLIAAAAWGVAMAWRGAGKDGTPQPWATRVLPVAALLWLGAATVQIVAPGKFYDHYFLMWLPPLCVLAALGLRSLVRRFVRPRRRDVALAGLAALLAAAPVIDLLRPRVEHGFGLRLPDPSRQVAAAIAPHLERGEAIYVANYYGVVYVLSGAAIPTRYAYGDHLAGHFSSMTGIDADAELARVLASAPRFIVVSRGRWNMVRPAAQEAILRALDESYAKMATIQDGPAGVEVWQLREGRPGRGAPDPAQG